MDTHHPSLGRSFGLAEAGAQAAVLALGRGIPRWLAVWIHRRVLRELAADAGRSESLARLMISDARSHGDDQLRLLQNHCSALAGSLVADREMPVG